MVNMKKVCAWILAAMMMIATVPQIMANDASTTDYVWMEAEKFTLESGGYQVVKEKTSSAGYYLCISSADAESVATYSFTVPKSKSYDMYILSTPVDVSHLSRPQWKLNDGEYAKCGTAVSDKVFGAYYGQMNNQPMSWYFMGTQTLTTDTSYKLSVKVNHRTLTNSEAVNAIDVVVVVPSDWSWTPNGFNLPSRSAYVLKNGIAYTTNTNADGSAKYEKSGNAVLAVDDTQYANGLPVLTYDFEVDAGDYEIWLDCGYKYRWSHTGYSLDGTNYKAVFGMQSGADTGTVYNYHRGANVKCAWRKLGVETLPEGENTLYLTPMNPDGLGDYWSIVRRVAIVPVSYSWVPAVSDIPTKSSFVYTHAKSYDTNSGYSEGGNFMGAFGALSTLPQMAFTIYLQETDSYDIWVECSHGTDGSVNAIKLDNTNAVNVGGFANGAVTESANIGANHNASWKKAETRIIRKGKHTLTLQPGEKDSLSRYRSMFGKIAVVPSSWNWTPEQSSIPAAVASDVQFYEAESISSFNTQMSRFESAADAPRAASARGALYILSSDATNLYADLTFKIPEDGEYSIYALASSPKTSVYSPFKTSFNGAEPNYVTQNQGFELYIGDEHSFSTSTGVAMDWMKVEDLSLSAGTYTYSFVVDEASSDNRYIFGLDVIAIVPKNDAIDLTGLTAAEGNAVLQASTIKLADDLSNVTENLTLPNEFIKDTDVEWTSSNTDVIDATGTVTRGSEDQNVVLTATFSVYNAGQTTTKAITYNITVPKIPTYTVTDVVVDNEIASNAVLTASTTVTNLTEENPNAILAIALYDGQGRLLKVDADVKAYTAEGTSYSASVTCPEDVTDVTVKTFLWNVTTQKPMN